MVEWLAADQLVSGSIPVESLFKCAGGGNSSIGRMSASKVDGCQFESGLPHFFVCIVSTSTKNNYFIITKSNYLHYTAQLKKDFILFVAFNK